MSGTGFENYMVHKHLMKQQAKKAKTAVVAAFCAGALFGGAIGATVATLALENKLQKPEPTEAIVQEEFER